MCSAVTSFWPCVPLSRIFGCVVGCVWPWVQLLEVFGRVFRCYKFLAVCSAVSSVGPCVRLLQFLGRVFSCCKRWPCVRPFQVLVGFGFVIFFMFLFVRFSTCFGLYPFILSLAPSFFLGRFIVLFLIFVPLSLCIRFSFTFSACLFCFVLVVIFVFFCFARTLVNCFSLGARSFSFVIVVVSAFCSMQCSLVPHHLSLIRFSVFCRVIFSIFTYYRHADFS